MAYITAYGALAEGGQVRSGDHVLITAASSRHRRRGPPPFDLADIVEAHRYMESNVQVGKIVVRVTHEDGTV
ncbi:hypothetical protein ACWDSL_25655 [Streptomyces sp. NPDC000941]